MHTSDKIPAIGINKQRNENAALTISNSKRKQKHVCWCNERTWKISLAKWNRQTESRRLVRNNLDSNKYEGKFAWEEERKR